MIQQRNFLTLTRPVGVFLCEIRIYQKIVYLPYIRYPEYKVMGEYAKKYYSANKELISARLKARKAAPKLSEEEKRLIKINRNLRRRLLGRCVQAFSPYGKRVSSAYVEPLLGDINEARKHLESKFDSNMNWSNIGKWHIDHVQPLHRSLDISELQRRLHYTNIQPLWAIDNIKKGINHMEH